LSAADRSSDKKYDILIFAVSRLPLLTRKLAEIPDPIIARYFVTGEEMGKNPVSLIFYRRCRRMYALCTLMNLDFFTADVGGCTRYGR
jgi:hypothetical protein